MRGLIALALGAVCLLAIAATPAWRGAAAQPSGTLDLRITDHRPGIADFRWLEVTVGALAIHRKGEGRKTGWVDLVEVAPAIDIVPLKDGLWRPLATVAVPAGDYDALRVRFVAATGELLNSGRPEVRTDDTVVRFDLTVRPDAVQPLVLDLYAEDLTDHEPQHYVVRVKEVRLGRPGDRPAGADGQRVRSGISASFGPREIAPLCGARRQDMPKHIQRQATRQRGNFAGSPPSALLGDGSDFRQGGVAKALWCSSTTAPSAPTPGGNPIPPNGALMPLQTLRS